MDPLEPPDRQRYVTISDVSFSMLSIYGEITMFYDTSPVAQHGSSIIPRKHIKFRKEFMFKSFLYDNFCVMESEHVVLPPAAPDPMFMNYTNNPVMELSSRVHPIEPLQEASRVILLRKDGEYQDFINFNPVRLDSHRWLVTVSDSRQVTTRCVSTYGQMYRSFLVKVYIGSATIAQIAIKDWSIQARNDERIRNDGWMADQSWSKLGHSIVKVIVDESRRVSSVETYIAVDCWMIILPHKFGANEQYYDMNIVHVSVAGYQIYGPIQWNISRSRTDHQE
jgi:hypothetical protein